MFLWISYNRWHLILAFLVQLTFQTFFTFCFLAEFWPDSFERMSLAVSILTASYFAAFVTVALQAFNEAVQLYDQDILQKHGTYPNFIKDSKDDWKNVFIGMILAFIASSVVSTIYFYQIG